MAALVGDPLSAMVSSSIVLGIQIGDVGEKQDARDKFPFSRKGSVCWRIASSRTRDAEGVFGKISSLCLPRSFSGLLWHYQIPKENQCL